MWHKTAISNPDRRKYSRAAEQHPGSMEHREQQSVESRWKKKKKKIIALWPDSVFVWRATWLIMLQSWKAASPAYIVTDYWRLHRYHSNPSRYVGDVWEQYIRSDHLQIIVQTPCISDPIWETNRTRLLSEHGLNRIGLNHIGLAHWCILGWFFWTTMASL